jgi:hypothetical protein
MKVILFIKPGCPWSRKACEMIHDRALNIEILDYSIAHQYGLSISSRHTPVWYSKQTGRTFYGFTHDLKYIEWSLKRRME